MIFTNPTFEKISTPHGGSILVRNFSYVESDGAFIFQLKNITDIAEITEALKKSKIEIIDMQTVDTDLENVFLKLTGAK